jgi:hypothetical protein
MQVTGGHVASQYCFLASTLAEQLMKPFSAQHKGHGREAKTVCWIFDADDLNNGKVRFSLILSNFVRMTTPPLQ